MSYRDLRNFTEMMRALGYNRLISMENFRVPNFPLVAEILIWLVRRFEPDANIYTSFESEEDRIKLVRSVTQCMAVSNNIKLNTKRLYQADGYTVKELLKITSLLYNAMKFDTSEKNNTDDDERLSSTSGDISSRISDLKLTRELSSQITVKGASLFELLGLEPQLREERINCINNQLELNAVEAGLKEAIQTSKSSVTNTQNLIDNVAATESSLDSKIEKRQAELDRNNKRLETLKKVRPAFLEEFERLEVELRRLYQDYITRFRCVAFLEQLLEDADIVEQERMEERQLEMHKMLEKMQQEEALKLLDDSFDFFPTEDSNVNVPAHNVEPPPSKPKVTRVGTSTAGVRRRVYGGMIADDDDSLESDSDLLLDDDDNSQLLASDDDLELLATAGNKQSDHSEDHSDF